MITVLGLWASNQLAAEESATIIESARYPADEAADRINAILDQRLKTPLKYDGEQLDIVLMAISEEYDIPIVFDKAALDEVAISPESEISINLRSLSLRSTLNLMLKEPGLEDLCYIINDEVLLITTKERADEALLTQVYRVDDLETANRVPQPMGASAWADFSPIVDVVTSCVERDAWRENGTGEGEIRLVKPGMLVITQTRRVHHQVEMLFDQLRQKRREIMADAASKTSSTTPKTQGFVVNIALGEKSEQVQQRLVKAIKNSVDWSTGDLPENATWIEILPNRVLVHHLPSVVAQVQNTLLDMQLVNAQPVGNYSAGGGGDRGKGVRGGGF